MELCLEFGMEKHAFLRGHRGRRCVGKKGGDCPLRFVLGTESRVCCDESEGGLLLFGWEAAGDEVDDESEVGFLHDSSLRCSEPGARFPSSLASCLLARNTRLFTVPIGTSRTSACLLYTSDRCRRSYA